LTLVVAGGVYLARDASSPSPLGESHYLGDPAAADKVAVVRVAGVLVEGMTGFAKAQIEQAAKDPAVKAVVVRIDSPGGTISASDDLHRELTRLRDNTHPRFTGSGPKPLVASMGSVAASGGYYVAMPAGKVFAEPTTVTGSIGVFVALPNVSELANKHGVRVELIKAGDIKAGGSFFHALSPAERQPWQDLVDHAYDRFLGVVATGRPGLSKERLVEDRATRTVPVYDDKGLPQLGSDGKPKTTAVTRYRADGGSYTAPEAKRLGLIDDLGELPDAVKHAATTAGLTRFRAVTYERPKTWLETVTGISVQQPGDGLSAVATPKLWYLAPHFDLNGFRPQSVLPLD
jgi:protease-4